MLLITGPFSPSWILVLFRSMKKYTIAVDGARICPLVCNAQAIFSVTCNYVYLVKGNFASEVFSPTFGEQKTSIEVLDYRVCFLLFFFFFLPLFFFFFARDQILEEYLSFHSVPKNPPSSIQIIQLKTGSQQAFPKLSVLLWSEIKMDVHSYTSLTTKLSAIIRNG